MTSSLIPAALALADIVPVISKWFAHIDEVDLTRKVADQVVRLAQRLTSTQDPMMAVEILKQNPELLLCYQKELNTIDYERDFIRFQDLKNARQRDSMIIAAGQGNMRADIMVIAAALGLILCLVSLAYYQGELPGEAVGIISTIAGIFGGCLKDAYAFEFGSSRGSKTKDLTALINRGREI